MDKKKILHTITFVLLTLIFFKVSAIHAYSHQDSASNQIENCKVCDSAIENQNAEHLLSSSDWTEIFQIELVSTAINLDYSQPFTTSKVHFRVFGRPPPTLG